jgi:hypothetical protein
MARPGYSEHFQDRLLQIANFFASRSGKLPYGTRTLCRQFCKRRSRPRSIHPGMCHSASARLIPGLVTVSLLLMQSVELMRGSKILDDRAFLLSELKQKPRPLLDQDALLPSLVKKYGLKSITLEFPMFYGMEFPNPLYAAGAPLPLLPRLISCVGGVF